jgi:hypothetical protein
MANNGKFLNIDTTTGRTKQEAAVATSAGAADAGKIPALDAGGKFDSTMMPVGLGSDSKSGILASEAIAAGSLVNVYNNAGVLNVRKADATAAGKEANGFALAAISNAQTGTIYFEGTITGLTGLTPGTRYYLSAATPGTATLTPPSASGNVIQFVGVSLSATEITFEADDGIILA